MTQFTEKTLRNLPVLRITEEQRTVGAFRDYEQVQTTVTYSQTGNVLSTDQVTLKKTTINEAIFFQQKIYVFGLYIGTTTGRPVFGEAPLPP